MDRLEAMKAFLAAVDSGSLSAGARALRVPLATISRRVADLERHLGAQLLLRGARRLTLTDAGTAYCVAARRILEDLAEAERVAAGEYSLPTGELVVSATEVLGRTHLLPVLCEFLRAYPNIRVRLDQVDHTVDLLQEGVDVALRIGEPLQESLVAVHVGSVSQVICASPEYLRTRGVPASVAALAHHDCVVMRTMGSAGPWDFSRSWLGYEGKVRARIVVSNAEAAHEAIRQGMGIGHLMSYQAADGVEAGELEYVLHDLRPPGKPVHLLYVGRRPLPRKLRAFIDFAAPRLRALLDNEGHVADSRDPRGPRD